MGKDKPRKGIQAGGQNTPRQHWRFLQLQFKNWKLSCMRGLNSWLGRPWTPISELLAANTHFTTELMEATARFYPVFKVFLLHIHTYFSGIVKKPLLI